VNLDRDRWLEGIRRIIRGHRQRTSISMDASPRRSISHSHITIGTRVTVNGKLHRDAHGNGAGLVESNATRLVNLIAPNTSHPYHVTLLDGTWRGWVSEGAITRIIR